VVAALITPPDVISQLLLAVPMLFLFEGTLLFMWFTARRTKKQAKAEPANAEPRAEEPEFPVT
jgi:sec-independent protein translocase protein TatC